MHEAHDLYGLFHMIFVGKEWLSCFKHMNFMLHASCFKHMKLMIA
jgi:hypothetical protein